MFKVCIWLGPAVVCLQIYCWSPAIYVPNWRQNLKKASTRRQGPKNYRQFWAEQFSAKKRTAAGKIELGGADLLSFCLQQPSWKSLNDDEELQEEKLATMSQLFQNNSVIGLDTNQPYGGGTGFHPANPINENEFLQQDLLHKFSSHIYILFPPCWEASTLSSIRCRSLELYSNIGILSSSPFTAPFANVAPPSATASLLSPNSHVWQKLRQNFLLSRRFLKM